MKKELVLKILKIIVCSLLSIILVIGVVLVPFYYSITALTEPETVAMVIQDVDYKRAIEKNSTVKKTLAKYGITTQEAQTIMKSQQTGELIEVYTDEVTEILLDIPDDAKIDIPYIKRLVDENADKFLNIAEQNINLKFKRQIVQKNIDDFFEKNEKTVQEAIPIVREVKDVVKTIHTSHIAQKTLTLQFALIFIISVFLILGVIILIMRSNGFLWAGIDFGIISVILCVVIAFSKSNFITRVALRISDFGTQIIESAISISTEKIIIAVFGTIILTALFMGFFVVLKLLKKKYQKQNYIEIPIIKE